MDETYSAVISEKELLTRTYDRYFSLQAEAERNEFDDMRSRKSERLGQQCIDADLALWLNWIRAGLPGDEWHVYYGKLIKSF